MNTNELGRMFAMLASTQDWRIERRIFEHEEKILLDVTSAAGFEPKNVVLGKLRGRSGDDVVVVNDVCTYKVIDERGDDLENATHWLNCLVKYAIGLSKRGEDLPCIIKKVVEEIERSVPLRPIQLTREGDLLCEYPTTRWVGYFLEHERDNDEFSVTTHKYCGSFMDRKRVTEWHDAIVCRGCNLRVLFPKEIKTYGGLREFMSKKLFELMA